MSNIFSQTPKPKVEATIKTSSTTEQITIKLQQGLALHNLGQFDKALFFYKAILKLNPRHFDALQLSGTIAAQTMQWKKALKLFNDALKINNKNAYVYNNLGTVNIALKYWNEALANFNQAIELKHDYAEAYSNRGRVLQELDHLEEALVNYDKAIELKIDYQKAYYNRGLVLHELKRLEDAIHSYDKAIELSPNFAEAHNNKAISLLLRGDFVEGFKEYEWRWFAEESSNSAGKRIFTQPLWLGKETIANKTILLYSEQGLGDTLQFCRYAKFVNTLGAKVILEVQKPLFKLLQNLNGVSQIVVRGSALPPFDCQCPLMSLPLAFKTTIENIPNEVPYIDVIVEKENKWQRHIDDAFFNVAICWQGNPVGKADAGRSFPVSLFKNLANINGVKLISLQKNEGTEQLDNLQLDMKVERLSKDFDDGDRAFLDSVTVMKAVDLVITSDTALTHLAGALGIKTWLPLKYVPDWRWMLDTRDSPWYPNHRLFRQKIKDDWSDVFEEIELELRKLVATQKKNYENNI